MVILRWLTLLAVCGVILFLPLVKGGNTGWARGVVIMFVPFIFLLNWPLIISADKGSGHDTRAWLLVWTVFSFVIAVQLMPGLGTWLNMPLLTPCISAGVCESQAISPYPLITASHWAMFSIYWMVAWLISYFERIQVKVLVTVISLLAIFEAIYGLVAFVGGQETILGIWEKRYGFYDVTGTFINRNHFSGLLELTWPLLLSLVLLPRHLGGFHWPSKMRYAVVTILSLAIGLALFNSRSRLGIISAIFGLMIWFLLIRKEGKVDGVSVPTWLVASVMASALIGGTWFGMGTIIERYADLSDNVGRLKIWEPLFSLPPITWVVGAGAGAFVDVYRTVQPVEKEPLYSYAHSDILEFFLDFGLVGATMITGAFISWGRKILRGSLSLLQVGAVAGIAAIALHSFADFNLHIPGVAIVFWAMVGILSNPALRQKHHERRKKRQRRDE